MPEDNPHNFGNDYCDHYIHTGVLPQAHIQNIQDPLIGYPKLQRLHKLKAGHNGKHVGKPFGRAVSSDKIAEELTAWTNESRGLSFDVIMIGACVDRPPSYSTLVELPIHKLTPRPSILFLWVPGPDLELGRQMMEIWGFRRSEDIVYFCTSKSSLHFPKNLATSVDDCVVKSTWHCLMGLKGTLRRSEDTDLINCNIDTDVIVERSSERPNVVPEGIYSLIENFALMNRRLHIIPSDTSLEKPVRPRPGWVIVSPDILLDNFTPERYLESIGKGNTNFRIPIDNEIDNLRPKTPPKMKNNKR
ncbi:karyogamy protein Kar4p [Trichomonascus vanleenenianus]|uniref:Kar4p n=1 Tax=Trichomonascus vanleenenianus TaxID=2268995 RepID=UPI003ECB35E1